MAETDKWCSCNGHWAVNFEVPVVADREMSMEAALSRVSARDAQGSAPWQMARLSSATKEEGESRGS